MRTFIALFLVLNVLFGGSGSVLHSRDSSKNGSKAGFKDSWLVRQDVDPQTGEDLRMPLLMPDDFSELHLVGWRVERGTQDLQRPGSEQPAHRRRHAVGLWWCRNSRIGVARSDRFPLESLSRLYGTRGHHRKQRKALDLEEF